MTLEELTDTLARIDGRERQIIEAYLVRMRATRIIGTRNDVTAMDMASALVGLNVAHRAAEAPDAVRAFRGLRANLISGADSEWYLPDEVVEAGDFVETLAAIIETAPEIEDAFGTITRETLARDPGTSLGLGGEKEAMRLTVQMFSGAYSAGALRVETALRHSWGYGKKQRACENVFDTTWSDDDAPSRLDEQVTRRELSVICRLPVFLELHSALHAGAECQPASVDLFSSVSALSAGSTSTKNGKMTLSKGGAPSILTLS
jgi:hypothetical protein